MSEKIYEAQEHDGDHCPWCQHEHGLSALDTGIAGKELTCTNCGQLFDLWWEDYECEDGSEGVITHATKLKA